jgi:signal transduction histidine kinase
VAASEGQFQGEGWRVRKDGSQLWASVLITALRDPQNRLIGYSKIVRDLTARKQAEEALRRSERSLRYLSAKLLHVQDEERRRFASDLHDNAGQYLAMLKMRLDLLGSSSELDDGVRQKLAECTHLASETIKEVRATSYELYPPMLEEAGLRSAIPWFLEGFMERSGVTTRFEIPDGFQRPSRDVELAVFRVLQESLTNVRRHSGSTTADVRLDIHDGIMRLEVADQGKGIPREVLEAFDQGSMGKLGIGLRGMKERIRQLGGRLEVSSNGGGTIITATVPFDQPS